MSLFTLAIAAVCIAAAFFIARRTFDTGAVVVVEPTSNHRTLVYIRTRRGTAGVHLFGGSDEDLATARRAAADIARILGTHVEDRT